MEINIGKQKLSEEKYVKILSSNKDIEVLLTLPSDFDYIKNAELVIDILSSSVEHNKDKVKKWINDHNDFLNYLIEEPNNWIKDKAYKLCFITSDLSFMNKTGLAINEIYYWLKENDSCNLAQTYIRSCCYGKEDSFIQKLNLVSFLDKEDFTNIIKKCIRKKEQYSSLLNYIITYYADKDIDIIRQFVEENIDISNVYDKIGGLLNEMVVNNEIAVRHFLELCIDKRISFLDYFYLTTDACNELCVEFFIQTQKKEWLEKVNAKTTSKWINKQQRDFLSLFLNTCQAVYDDLNDDCKEIIVSIDSKCLSQEIYELLIKDIKKKLSYVAFDLEANDKEIKEFAFLNIDHIEEYEDEDQLDELIDALRETDIIVGHNIKKWDLERLKDKNEDYVFNEAFIWDTLEMEILLNPLLKSYALCAEHNAKDDTKLADELFWYQLYRLSKDETLCRELSKFLPTNIQDILKKLNQEVYSHYFSNTDREKFFHTKEDIDTNEELINKLEEINNQEGATLIIAPKRLWSRIAEYIDIKFIQAQSNEDYYTIKNQANNNDEFANYLLNNFLYYFESFSKTPIVANIPKYIKINYLEKDYLVPTNGHIECADMDIIQDESALNNYKQVYFVGCEIENKINKYNTQKNYKPSDFDNLNIPLRIGPSRCLKITSKERTHIIFNDVPKDAANVWIERQRNGEYCIWYNYDFNSRIKEIECKFKDKIVIIPWATTIEDIDSLYLVHSEKSSNFKTKHIFESSPYRAQYWTYQFALLSSINKNIKKSIILFVNSLEIEKVEKYAKKCGFYVPDKVSLTKKIQKLEHSKNGLLVVSNNDFFKVISSCIDTDYCYVWDNLDVEKYKMLWYDFKDEKNKLFLQDDIETPNNSKDRKDIYHSLLMSIWPVYKYYYNFIKESCSASSMYIMDPYFEDYHSLSSKWGVKTYEVANLWSTEDEYNKSLEKAKEVFTEESLVYDDDNKEIAMDTILSAFIKTNNPDADWTDIQRKILPLILEKKNNYLVSLPTGGGKSVLFQGPAILNARSTNKLSIVITPLKALMQDQVNELNDKGLYTNVDYLNSDCSYHKTKNIYKKIVSGTISLLYVTPERFRSKEFIDALYIRMANDYGLEYIIFDEAHCICQWGMEFRPDYLKAIEECKKINEEYPNTCILMFSATVTDMIYNQINNIIPIVRLGQDNNPIRDHINIEFKKVTKDKDKHKHSLDEVVKFIQDNHINPQKSRMLVFCRIRDLCKKMAELLREKLVELVENGVLTIDNPQQSVAYFHAGMEGDERKDVYKRFKDENDPLFILFATKAFGMGMDIPNIHYIVHLTPPDVLEDYLQEVGRAGRNKQMYEELGFSEDNPIPTLCLYSEEDIKSALTQLTQDSLTWMNIEQIRIKIIDYIKEIQSLEKTKVFPVVVPNTLWVKSQYKYDFNYFKMGQYWLERLGRIKLGRYSPTYINIQLLNRNAKLLNNKIDRVDEIVKELDKLTSKQQTNTIQISIQELATNLSMHSSTLLDGLIWCDKNKILLIEQTIRCRIANTRKSEVDYLIENEHSHLFALYIIFNTVRNLLSDIELKKEKTYSLSNIQDIIKNNAIDLQEIVNDKKYMPWHDETNKDNNIGLSLTLSYYNDLVNKRLHHIFTLLEMIPGVKVQSYLDATKNKALQSIIVITDSWKKWLEIFQNDCLRVLKYIYNSSGLMKWATAITELRLEEKGYKYFESILHFLDCMAYTSSDSLLPMGIEMYTTNITEKELFEDIKQLSPEDIAIKNDFDDIAKIRCLKLSVMDIITNKIRNKRELKELITKYFRISDTDGFSELSSKYGQTGPIWDYLRADEITKKKDNLNDQQLVIYNEKPDVNINVEAGPGSGKTYLLLLKCAKLIYQGVNPNNILVLAYNRAIITELKTKLTKLLNSLGFSQSASNINIFTFHGLAKRICGNILEKIDMKEWEKELFKIIQTDSNSIRNVIPELKYVFIDEFQDITQTRLNIIFKLKEIYSTIYFFTIGDKNQSIYGFEKDGSINPNFYYEKLYDELGSKRMSMNINYRSYPKILEAAKIYLPENSEMPESWEKVKEKEPKDQYVFIYTQKEWSKEFVEKLEYLQEFSKKIKERLPEEEGIKDFAVFFRTNNELYHGYSLIKNMNIDGIRIRIQGESAADLFRTREISKVLDFLNSKQDDTIQIDNNSTEDYLRDYVKSLMKKFENWDEYYFDLVFVLILDYLDLVKSESESRTYGNMLEYIKDTLREEKSDLYKLYDDKRFDGRRILNEKQMNVVLTTMHKVKGLEFDAVMITPSVASLPYNPSYNDEKELIEEEQRLLYVAYTRAKKCLFVYKGDREEAVENLKPCLGLEDQVQWGIRESEIKLANYNIGYNADYNYKNNEYIESKVCKNDPVIIKRHYGKDKNGKTFKTFDIVHNAINIGQLSRTSLIANIMEDNDIAILSGFFVSDVFRWNYDDTCKWDEINEKEYAKDWCQKAYNQGFIYIVDIAGYGKKY